MPKVDITQPGGLSLDAGYIGQVVDANPAVIESKRNNQSISIDFGNAVAESTTDDTCRAPTADGQRILGIAVRHAVKVANASGNVLYDQNDMVPILKSGYIYASPTQNVTRGTGVLSLTASNGALSGVSAGAAGAGRIVVPGATWETTTTAGQVGIVRIAS